MGKVKFVEQFRDYVEEKVSIPYGKGKVDKSFEECSTIICINSLWER